MSQLVCPEWQDSAQPNLTCGLSLPTDDQKAQDLRVLENVSLSQYCSGILRAMVMGAQLYPDLMHFSK
jgi:hypothetical protein